MPFGDGGLDDAEDLSAERWCTSLDGVIAPGFSTEDGAESSFIATCIAGGPAAGFAAGKVGLVKIFASFF